VDVYARLLARRGHSVTVVSLPRRPRPLRQRLREVLRGRPSNGLGEGSHLTGDGYRWRVLDRHRPVTDDDLPDADVTVATWWETAEWVASLDPAKGAGVYFCQHFEAHPEQPRERVLATYRLPLLQICVSAWVRDRIRSVHPGARSIVVGNAVNLELFRATERDRNSRFTVGTMLSRKAFKGSDIALEALELAREEVPELRMLAFSAGRDWDPARLPAGLELETTPDQERIAELYRSCDAWLFTSRVEGYGLPLLEAMASGTPVVATPAGAAPELVRDGENGLLVDLDPRAVAAGIVELSQRSREGWQRCSRAAIETARGHDWETQTERFEAALAGAVRDRDAARSAREAGPDGG
jgi:glycosyltransferase involved in cell wall biosynthesis